VTNKTYANISLDKFTLSRMSPDRPQADGKSFVCNRLIWCVCLSFDFTSQLVNHRFPYLGNLLKKRDTTPISPDFSI
jgi:hypothetical protein